MNKGDSIRNNDDDFSLLRKYDDVVVVSGYSGCGIEAISELLSAQLADALVTKTTVNTVTIDIREFELQRQRLLSPSLLSSSSTSTQPSVDDTVIESTAFVRFLQDCLSNNIIRTIHQRLVDNARPVLFISIILSPTRHVNVDGLLLVVSTILQSTISLSISVVVPTILNDISDKEEALRYE